MTSSTTIAANSESASHRDKVRRYYKAATEDYLRYYEAYWHHHMHYGFERDLPKGGNPTENLVRYLAEVGELEAGTKVLDAGCGVGGSAIWLAAEKKCHLTGITLMPMQASLAKGFAAKKNLDAPCCFLACDFTAPAFRPESFQAVWAIESFDHAPDKKQWVADMAALLQPGGRILIADGFRADRSFSPEESRHYDRFLKGWAVPNLCTADELENYAHHAGLSVSHREDITADILPHAFAIYRFGLIFGPLRWVMHRLGLTSAEKLGNAWATFHQYQALKRKLWTYEIFSLRKA